MELQLRFVTDTSVSPNLEAWWQEAFPDICGAHLHGYHNVGEELSLYHVLDLINITWEALQDKTCSPTRCWKIIKYIVQFEMKTK